MPLISFKTKCYLKLFGVLLSNYKIYANHTSTQERVVSILLSYDTNKSCTYHNRLPLRVLNRRYERHCYCAHHPET